MPGSGPRSRNWTAAAGRGRSTGSPPTSARPGRSRRRHGRARREMSVAFTIRAVLLMTVMPDADHREVLTTLLGELLEVPWRRAHAVPSGTVLSSWRTAIGEAPLQQLQRELLAAVGAEHRDPALPRVEVGGGLRLGAIDGTVTRMPDTAANRAAFGTAGAAETGYPQIRHLHVSDALTRATLAVVCGPAGGDKAGQGQGRGRAGTAGPDAGRAARRVRPRPVVDHGSELPRRAADRGAAGHRQPRAGPRQVRHPAAPDRPVRRRRVLPDPPVRRRHQPGHAGRRVPRQTWTGRPHPSCSAWPPTCSTTTPTPRICSRRPIGGAGTAPRPRCARPSRPSTTPDPEPGRSCARHSPELIRQEHAAWIAATELVRAATRSAAAIATPFRKGPRTGQPVAARQLSFTTARRTLIATVRAGDRHRLVARTRPGRRPPARPGRDRHRAGHHRPTSSPRPHDQIQAGVLARPARHHHPHRARSSCTSAAPPRPDPAPSRPPTRTYPGPEPGAPGQTAGPPPCAQPVVTLRTPLEDHHKESAAPRTTSSPWHWPVRPTCVALAARCGGWAAPSDSSYG